MRLNDTDNSSLNHFIDDFCNLDGAFVFAIIRRNTNYMTTSDIISSLYHSYTSDNKRSKRFRKLTQENAVIDMEPYEGELEEDIVLKKE